MGSRRLLSLSFEIRLKNNDKGWRMRVAMGLLLGLLWWAAGLAAERNDELERIWLQTLRVEQEIGALERHFEIAASAPVHGVTAPLALRHAWQKGYEIEVKLNALRRRHGVPIITPRVIEPVVELPPFMVFEQTALLLTELQLLRARLGAAEPAAVAPAGGSHTPLDLYNKLNELSYRLDPLIGERFTPSQVFAEAMRLFEDTRTLIDSRELLDETVPPPRRADATLSGSFDAALQVLAEEGRIQGMLAIEHGELWGMKGEEVHPGDVFALIQLAIAELQPVKARLGLRHVLTPPAGYYEGKSPAEVQQVLGWTLRKLQLLRTDSGH